MQNTTIPQSAVCPLPRTGEFRCIHSCFSLSTHVFKNRSNWRKHVHRITHPACNDNCTAHSWKQKYDSLKKRTGSTGNKKRKASVSLPPLPPHSSPPTTIVSSLVQQSECQLPSASAPSTTRSSVPCPVISTLPPLSSISTPAIVSPATSSSTLVHPPSIVTPPPSLRPVHRTHVLAPMTDLCVFDDIVSSNFQQHGHVVFTPYITQDPIFTPTPIIDFTAFINKKYNVHSIPFKVVNMEIRAPPIKKTFKQYYVGRLPLDIEQVRAALQNGDTINFYQKDADFKDEKASVYSNVRGVKNHPMNLNSIAKHPRSLLSLVDYEHRGFNSVYGYQKQYIDHFNAHFEQVKGPFVHHILKGKIRWYMVPPNQSEKLKLALLKLIKTNLHLEAQSDLDDMLWVLLAAKQIFPPPDFLLQQGVEVISFDLIAGECLYCDGDWVHFGFNQAPHSISLAVNVLSEVWLKTGPAFVREHLEWLQRVRDNKSRAIQSNPVFERVLSLDNLQQCFNVCPHGWGCHLFTRLKSDIEFFIGTGKSKFQYELPVPVLALSLVEINKVLVLLHTLKDFYLVHDQDVCQCDDSPPQ